MILEIGYFVVQLHLPFFDGIEKFRIRNLKRIRRLNRKTFTIGGFS